MSDATTLSQLIQQRYTELRESLDDKTIEDIGGTNAALIMVINEIVNKIYPFMYAQAIQFENFLSTYETNAESVNKSLQALNKQMTNQNKVLDKQVIKLSKSISKIAGEQ